MKFAYIQSAVLALTPAVLGCWPEAQGKSIKYTSVPGYFMQDDPKTDNSQFNYLDNDFGLIDRSYPTDKTYNKDGNKTKWQRFARWVSYLNSNCRKDSNVRYKVMIMGRHGQGFHNAAESYYGTPAWNCYWAELDGNGTSTWADAKLTPQGFVEAYKANAFFKDRWENHGMPAFESYYSSPLTRCTQTAQTTFGNLTTPATLPFAPVIKEFFRESISIHTCDRRSNKTTIASMFPNFSFEKGFTETDELWRGASKSEGETSDGQSARSRTVIDDVFTNDPSTWISLTSHSGEIASILGVLNHRSFGLSTGQIIPVLVKAELVGKVNPTPVVAFTAEATCKSPPVTSIGGQGCVCSSAPTTIVTSLSSSTTSASASTTAASGSTTSASASTTSASASTTSASASTTAASGSTTGTSGSTTSVSSSTTDASECTADEPQSKVTSTTTVY